MSSSEFCCFSKAQSESEENKHLDKYLEFAREVK